MIEKVNIQLLICIGLILLIIALWYLSSSNEGFKGLKMNGRNRISLYYAPWCPHCKTFMPEWKRFEELNKNNPNLLIETFDCEDPKNKDKRELVPGFPTVILTKQNGQKIMMENHERSVDGLTKFINENQ